jgi:two-component system response regulator HydG
LLAARAASDISASPEWLVAVLSLGFSLTPLTIVGARPSPRVSALALMGFSLAIATASARTGSEALDVTHDVAWLITALVMLGLALPRSTSTSVRYSAVAGYALAATTASILSNAGLLPAHAFGVVVVVGLLAVAALHQIVLVGRGHTVEGALSGIAVVSLAVGLAYAWFGPFTGRLATAVEAGVALLLWLGHLAWVDPRWRSLRRIGVPIVAACAVCFIAAFALLPSAPLHRWELGFLAIGAGALWWTTFALARRLSMRAIWTTSGRLADACVAARHRLLGGTTVEDITSGALIPLAIAVGGASGPPELYSLEPPLRMRLDSGERPNIRSGEPPSVLLDALYDCGLRGVIDLPALRPRVVREPAVRELVDAMERGAVGAALPCVHLDHLEGILLIPIGERTETLSAVEHDELGRLGRSLGGALAAALAQRRAESHIHELAELRRDAESEITALRGEVQQLRGQCDVLGRGLAEDHTLHVAYSPSMRRVQTRAIELAPTEDPVLLIAGAGSPVLPVSRFIHDRGPRWDAPFVVADCSASAPDEVMGLLFGSSEGPPGWFHSATGGTLLLRDLPALPREAQARLAAALGDAANTKQDEEPASCPPRIIATSRIDLGELRRRDALDPDLLTSFTPGRLAIPPLRERREDVPSLVLLAIDRACRVFARDPVGIDQQAMIALVDHDWPGDVAELELVVELAVERVAGKAIGMSDLPPLAWPAADGQESLSGTYVDVERRMLLRALHRAGNNKSEAARRLGLKRTTFLDKLRRHGLDERAPDDVGGTAVG